MLEKMFKKDKKERSLNILLVLGIIVVAIFLGGSPKDFANITNQDIEEVNVRELLTNINDNYSVVITKSINEDKYVFDYSRDKNVELFDEGENSDKTYLIYKNKYYYIDPDNHKLFKVKDIPKLKEPYTDLDLIKKVLNICKFEDITSNSKKCTIKVKTYLNEYNEIYNTEYTSEDDMNISVTYNSKNIKSIVIEYTNANKVINNNEDIVKYEFVFSEIDENNFDDILDYYKKELK